MWSLSSNSVSYQLRSLTLVNTPLFILESPVQTNFSWGFKIKLIPSLKSRLSMSHLLLLTRIKHSYPNISLKLDQKEYKSSSPPRIALKSKSNGVKFSKTLSKIPKLCLPHLITKFQIVIFHILLSQPLQMRPSKA